MGVVGETCPDPDALSALASDVELPDQERVRLATHAAECDACSAALEVLRVVAIGTPPAGPRQDSKPVGRHSIGRYVIDSMLGAGGMGVVYKATDPELQRVVALKVLRRGAPAARLKREAQALAKLDHPNVVSVYDVGTQDEMFIAMAFVDGETLREWLAKEPRELERVVDVLIAAGRGVVAAHEVGLIHRDLKPDNIFISLKGQVMVGDFGLVRDFEDADGTPGDPGEVADDLTRSSLVGTPAYMAPEQATGTATTASDQFAFCVTAWEALTGTRPFEGRTFAEILANARTGKHVEPAAGRAMPRRIDIALRRGLAADPIKRFGSMDDLLSALTKRDRIRWAVAIGAVACGTAIVMAWLAARPPGESLLSCDDDGAQMVRLWTPARRAEVEHALTSPTQKTVGPLAAHMLEMFDDTATTWIASWRSACHGQASAGRASFEQRIPCLARIATTFDVATQMLIESHATSSDQSSFLETALPVRRCTSSHPQAVAPPTFAQHAEVEQIREVLVRLRLAPTSSETASQRQSLLERAKRTGYDPVVGEVAAFVALSAYELDDFETAKTTAKTAIEVADRSNDHVVRADAAATLGRALARLRNFDGASEQLTAAGNAWQATDNDRDVEVAILNARADVARIVPTDDRLELQEKLVNTIRAVYGPRSTNLFRELSNLESMYPPGDPKKSAAINEAFAIPFTDDSCDETVAHANAEVDRVSGDLPRMIDAQRALAVAAEGCVAPDHVADVMYAYEILARYLGLATRSRDELAAYRRALELYQKVPNADLQDYFDMSYGVGGAQLDAGEIQGAIETLETTRKRYTDKIPSPRDRITLDVTLGRAYEAATRHADAVRTLDPLIEGLREAKPPQPAQFASACSSLASALWSVGGARVRARELAGDAINAYSTALEELDHSGDTTRGPQRELLKRRYENVKSWLAARGN
jgi:serine/threonine protein kinase/tetratricopeptide (TPR) repeat protein